MEIKAILTRTESLAGRSSSSSPHGMCNGISASWMFCCVCNWHPSRPLERRKAVMTKTIDYDIGFSSGPQCRSAHVATEVRCSHFVATYFHPASIRLGLEADRLSSPMVLHVIAL
ncbi:hypothetical protein CBR_g37874 [Chara braunii]|uniref:Uncharacterized protein n=1 Tax=Chara braunii TaxID=69332 RepID=A0A388LNS4_CHABU|nr:hypothetical protein CBR_g37874 [Chara braunii]|eukprot:GBG84000.1 hypothetical protein CBR_g37874 [Chara braunii]